MELGGIGSIINSVKGKALIQQAYSRPPLERFRIASRAQKNDRSLLDGREAPVSYLHSNSGQVGHLILGIQQHDDRFREFVAEIRPHLVTTSCHRVGFNRSTLGPIDEGRQLEVDR